MLKRWRPFSRTRGKREGLARAAVFRDKFGARTMPGVVQARTSDKGLPNTVLPRPPPCRIRAAGGSFVKVILRALHFRPAASGPRFLAARDRAGRYGPCRGPGIFAVARCRDGSGRHDRGHRGQVAGPARRAADAAGRAQCGRHRGLRRRIDPGTRGAAGTGHGVGARAWRGAAGIPHQRHPRQQFSRVLPLSSRSAGQGGGPARRGGAAVRLPARPAGHQFHPQERFLQPRGRAGIRNARPRRICADGAGIRLSRHRGRGAAQSRLRSERRLPADRSGARHRPDAGQRPDRGGRPRSRGSAQPRSGLARLRRLDQLGNVLPGNRRIAQPDRAACAAGIAQPLGAGQRPADRSHRRERVPHLQWR